MPAPVRSAVLLASVAVLGACSYDSGSLASSRTTLAPSTAVPVTTTVLTPLIGTLPLLPGQILPPTITVPEYTVPVDTAAATTVDPPPTTAKKPAAPTTVSAATTAVATTATTVAQILGVQAGAYTDKKTAEMGLASLAGKGFSGFQIIGKKPYRLLRQPLTRDAATALVTSLKKAGWPALITVLG